MPVYRYRALDSSEKVQTGVLEAASSKDARMRLLERNLFLLEISGSDEGKNTAPSAGRFLSRKRADELALATRQFATLVKAGIPLADALGALVDEIESSKLAAAVRDVRDGVTHGMSLADALKRHPRFFSPFYVNMVRVGEASGEMDAVLERLAAHLHGQSRLRNKVIGALTYPVLMLGIGVLVVAFLITFVVPKITQVLVDSGRPLPAPTLVLMGISGFFAKFWWLVIAAAAGAYFLYRAVVSTDGGRLARDSFVLKIPFFGELIKKHIIARFAMTFSTLLGSGLPAMESLEIVEETVSNKVLQSTVARMRERLIEGGDISSILKKSGVFPPLVGYMISVGEESGNLGEMLDIISGYYYEEVDFATARFTSVLEPIMIIVLAALVGFVVLSVILPILELSEIV
jgi:general secretion pathway protein F